ncbi:hypothetical protein [Nonomuraea jabiensis]|uniref:hypothetical protein n=1 Tax=Nonomuraea jabiensis TaxID=882448 RepID=UPI003D74C711
MRISTIRRDVVIELDKHFWRPGLEATPPDQWAAVQGELVRAEAWIMDGDLGPYDVPDVRLQKADTVMAGEPALSGTRRLLVVGMGLATPEPTASPVGDRDPRR